MGGSTWLLNGVDIVFSFLSFRRVVNDFANANWKFVSNNAVQDISLPHYVTRVAITGLYQLVTPVSDLC